MSSTAIPGNKFRKRPIACLLATAVAIPCLASESASPAENTLSVITVTGQTEGTEPTERTRAYTVAKSRSAAGLNLSLRETPQTVSVITRELMDDFRLNNANDALSVTSGVMVEKVETNRTYYTARGFDITNFQVDGIGMPFAYGNVNGDIDTAPYDRIDAVYGANGLMSSTGFPSATINFIRKRPTAKLQASTRLTTGSWNTRRIEADVSNALVDSGNLRGRMVFAREDGNSYLDRHAQDKTVFYGIVEGDLTDSTQLAVGYSYQENNASSPLWGSLPMFYTDGSRTHYDVSTSTAADWAYWDSRRKTAFAELTHQFNEDWQGKAVLTHNIFDNGGALFYVYGTPDKASGLGLFAYPSLYEMRNTQIQADVQLTGKFDAGGRRHDLTFGGSSARSELEDISHYGRGIGTPLPPFGNDWTGNYPMPAFDASTNGSDFSFTQKSLFAATRLNLLDQMKVIAGLRSTQAESHGNSYGTGRQSSAHAITPYFGVIYDLTANLSVYGSYTDIFTPQYQVDINGNALKPVEGNSREIGLKGEFFGGKLNASAALFESEQNNLAEVAGYLGAMTYYRGIDANATGFQLDVSGQLTPRWQASAGYTHVSIHDDQGRDVRTYAPRHLLRLSTAYRVPTVDPLKIGATISWQDDAYGQSGSNELRQKAYSLVNLMARYDISRNLSVHANLNNVTNEKYLTSLYWASQGQGYYGAPRNASLSLNWTY